MADIRRVSGGTAAPVTKTDVSKPGPAKAPSGTTTASAAPPTGWVPSKSNPALYRADADLNSTAEQLSALSKKMGLSSSASDKYLVEWKPVSPTGKLYVDDIGYDDVVQGGMGDCFLVASLSSQALADKEVIRNAITDNHDGSYSVRFFEKSGSGFKPISVKVAGELPVRDGKPLYLHNPNGKVDELWGPIVEKAYAQWKGGSYDSIGSGGRAEDVLTALSGKSVTSDFLPLFDFMLRRKVQNALAEHRPIVAGSWPAGSKQGDFGKSVGVQPGHAYSVVGSGVENGTNYIDVRDPNREGKSVLTRLNVSDFAKAFVILTVQD